MRDCIKIPEMLLPNVKDMTKWSCVACDQFSSDRGYWERLKSEVGDAPSALNLIVPEVYLSDGDLDERISSVLSTMNKYVSDGVLEKIKSGFILVERSTVLRQIPRFGIMLAVDLDAFFLDGKSGAIRPSESTVADRVPARIRIRRGAQIEMPHSMFLYDDKENFVLGEIIKKRASFEKVYDFPLNMNGGSIKGYFIPRDEAAAIKERFYSLAERNGGMLFAVGDGNHAVLSAKRYWQEKMEGVGSADGWNDEEARYFLTEAVNLYDPALVFEAIHRLVRVRDKKDFLSNLETYVGPFTEKKNIVRFNGFYNQIEYLTKLDSFIKAYGEARGAGVDYIYGEAYLKRLVERDDNSLGIVMNPLERSALFSHIRNGGVLPRKTFSIGGGIEKRYYLEARLI